MLRPIICAFVLTLTGCAPGVTIDQAYGRPDATSWTYFRASANDIVNAITEQFALQGVDVESVSRREDGLLLTVARRGSADSQQILVQATDVEDFSSRAQLYPSGRALSRGLERAVTGRL